MENSSGNNEISQEEDDAQHFMEITIAEEEGNRMSIISNVTNYRHIFNTQINSDLRQADDDMLHYIESRAERLWEQERDVSMIWMYNTYHADPEIYDWQDEGF